MKCGGGAAAACDLAASGPVGPRAGRRHTFLILTLSFFRSANQASSFWASPAHWAAAIARPDLRRLPCLIRVLNTNPMLWAPQGSPSRLSDTWRSARLRALGGAPPESRHTAWNWQHSHNKRRTVACLRRSWWCADSATELRLRRVSGQLVVGTALWSPGALTGAAVHLLQYPQVGGLR